MKRVWLWTGICVKYFLSFCQKKTATRKNYLLFNGKIDQNTNFCQIAKCQMAYFLIAYFAKQQ